MSPGAWVTTAMFSAGTALIAWVVVACWRDSRRATGRAPLYRRLRGALAGRRVRVPRDGEPLTDAEMGGFMGAMRGWALPPDRELARYEEDLQAYMQELREEGMA